LVRLTQQADVPSLDSLRRLWYNRDLLKLSDLIGQLKEISDDTDQFKKGDSMSKEATLTAVTITCPKDGKAYQVRADGYEIEWYASENECECCGSHGEVSMTFTCSGCGKDHSIELRSW